MSASVSTTPRRGRILALIVSAGVMVPAAVAFACNPQANISVDRTTVEPGATVTVNGSYFKSDTPITVSSPTGSTTVTSSSGGGFTTTVTAPSSPGTYVISASKPTGGSAPASFRVAAPAAAPAPVSSTPPAAAQQPAAAPAPAQSTASSPSFNEPGVSRSTRGTAQTQTSRSTAQRSTAPRSTSSRSAAPSSATATGQRFFSAAPAAAAPTFSAAPAAAAPTFSAAPAPAAAAPARSASARESSRGTARSTSPAPATSDLTATGDVWSGFAPGRTASLTAGADGMADAGAGNALTIGIGLLAFGLLSIVGGFAVAEAQRRRAPVR